MEHSIQKIKEGINVHIINEKKFKTDLVAIFLTTPMTRENVTYNAVLSSTLRRGSKNMPTQDIISKELEEMYGAEFDCGIDKTGDNHVLKFYMESVNDNFLPQNDKKMLKTSIEKLLEIVFNPLTESEAFKKEYVEQEKQKIKQIIEGKIDNKARYALDRCIEEMYKDKPYGLYKYGYIEDLENIDEKNLYEYYNTLIAQCKIDIFISGEVEKTIIEDIKNNENIEKLQDRKPKYIIGNEDDINVTEEKEITESMEVTQGKVVIGMHIPNLEENKKYDALVYNSILGGTANSKMFQNVREKASLAYTAGSNYMRYKNNIFIKCGIEIKNYEKAIKIIREQIEDMKKGIFADEDIENAKKGIISSIKSIDDEQDTKITYFFGQELNNSNTSLEEYIQKVQNVSKEEIINIANKVKIDTIYFLKD